MKRLLLLSVMAMLTMVSFGRKHVENATIVADTIFYAQNKMNVVSSADASYYRLLMTVGQGMNKQDVFQDFYMDGTLKAEGGYNFVDLGNDNNTVIDGEFTTYYPNGREKWHGQYVNGKRHGYFTMQMRDGGVAVVQYYHGINVHQYFTVTRADGSVEKHSLDELKALM